MALSIVRTSDEHLVNDAVVQALERNIAKEGHAVLLVPSIEQAIEAQRCLATHEGLCMGVGTQTPSEWVRENWEIWGDGRALADGSVLTILAFETLRAATAEERGPLALLPGTVRVLASLVSRALPWLPFDNCGRLDQNACEEAGLTYAEICLVRLAGMMARRLHDHGYVSASEASALLPSCMECAGANMPSVVVTGFSWMDRCDRELVGAFAHASQVDFLAFVPRGPASERVRQLVELLHLAAKRYASSAAKPVAAAAERQVPATEPMTASERQTLVSEASKPATSIQRDSRLAALLDALFTDTTLRVDGLTPVELLLPAGPVAEAEAVARRIDQLLCERDDMQVVVAVPDESRAWRELAPKLAARDIAARIEWQQPLVEHPTMQAFLGYAAEVARLSELVPTWPPPIDGLEGPVPQLGDMSWWPPREIIDFLFEDMAHMEAHQVWRLDALWRGNRLLTPARVLEMLQSERFVSIPVARATFELLRGRMGSAAAKLLEPYGASGSVARLQSAKADESIAVLEAILKIARALRSLDVRFDDQNPQARSLSEIVALMAWACEGKQLAARMGVGSDGRRVHVRIMDLKKASLLPCASADVLVVCGLTSAEQPLEGKEDVLQAILELLGIEPKADSLAKARLDFRLLLGVARSRLVLERMLADAEGQPSYPSVMLSELLFAYGIDSSASIRELPLEHQVNSERDLACNLSPQGMSARLERTSAPAPAGRLTQDARELVFVPPAGQDALPDGLPILSASQIETYLDCPYKWFSLRRLRLDSVDAGHGAVEMGTFAHRVLEITHRELLVRALEAEAGTTPDGEEAEAPLATLEASPARHVEGSRVSCQTLDEAQTTLDLSFDLHREHMYMVRNPRASQQLLVAHDSFDAAQEQRLKEDLLSTLAYQTGILKTFEPRFFEWGFGRQGDLVKYAGAYFTGTVDRIDVSPHGTAVIVDYKHKSPVGFASEYDALQEGVLDGVRLPARVQSLIYAQVVRRAFAGSLRLVGSVYLSTKSPHALAGVADENVADLVFGNLRAQRMARVCVPASEDGSSGMDALLDHTEELIAEQVQQMLAGNVEARPRDRRSCDFCPVARCEKRMAR